MRKRKEKWKTWWWYHRVHVLIAAAAIALVLYSVLPGMLEPKPDYAVALITTEWVPEETRAALEERIANVADDRNRDGRVLVELNSYQADLSGKTEGTVNYMEAARLDADLVGKVSSLLLYDDPTGFRSNTAISVEAEIPCQEIALFDELELPDGMMFTVRTDCEAGQIYEKILDRQRQEVQPDDLQP